MKKQNLSQYDSSQIPNGEEFTIGIVQSAWNQKITDALGLAAKETLLKHGVQESNIHEVLVPGSFELPFGAKSLLGKEKFHAIICIGCVIKGGTKHNEYISNAVASGLMMLGLSAGTPMIFGVLTPDSEEQALERSGGSQGNKGIEAAISALQMADISKNKSELKKSIGFGR